MLESRTRIRTSICGADFSTPGPNAPPLLRRLLDFEGERIQIMNEAGVDMHLLSLTSPGVQMFDADTATNLATLANDRLAEVIKKTSDSLYRTGQFRATRSQARRKGN